MIHPESPFAILLEASLLKAEEMKDYFAKKLPDLARQGREMLKAVIWIAFLSFIVSIPLLTVGIYLDSKILIIAAGLIRTIVSAMLLVILTPLGVLAGMVYAGSARAGFRRWMNFVFSVFLTELVMTLIFSLVPLKSNLGMVPVFFLVTSILGFLGFWAASPGLTGLVIFGIFSTMVYGFVFPYSFQSLRTRLMYGDENKGAPRRVELTCEDLTEGRIKFFGPGGKTRFGYSQDRQTGWVDVFEITTSNLTNPGTGQKLNLLKPSDIETLKRIVCSRPPKPRPQTGSDVARSQASSRNSERERREAQQQSEKTERARQEQTRARENMIGKYVRSRSFENLPNSTEAAVMFVDTDYRALDEWDRELVKRLIFADINTTGDFFQSSAAFEVFSKAYRDDQSFINGLDLQKRIDCLVLGIVSTEDVPKTGWSERKTRFRVAVRLVPVGHPGANMQEFKTVVEESRRDEAMQKALRAIQAALIPAIKSI